MGKSYRDMHRINELAQELIRELKKFDDYLQGEISYMSRDYIGMEVQAEMEKWGEDDPATVDVSDDVLHSINNEIDEWIKKNHPEIETVGKVIPLLKELSGED